VTKLLLLAAALGVTGAIALATTTGCNTGSGACPNVEQVVPGGACTEEELQCGFTLTTPNAACDGTSSTYDTSCTCTNGLWVCPDPIACEGGADQSDQGSAADEGGAE
jgi:hypothetical protein